MPRTGDFDAREPETLRRHADDHAVTEFLFQADVLTAVTQTIAWGVFFFFASAGAGAGYLTVSEIFPQEVRVKAIAVFFAIAQCSARSARSSTAR